MKNKKLFKTLTLLVIISLFTMNFVCFYMIKQRDEKIQSLENTIVYTSGRVNDIHKEIVKIDNGLVKTSDTILSRTDINSATLKELIKKLVEYGYIEPVENWKDDN